MTTPIPFEAEYPEAAKIWQDIYARPPRYRIILSYVFGYRHYGYFPTVIQCDNTGVERNDPCICKSGKKYKKCCGKGK